jgi:hypothetical protein
VPKRENKNGQRSKGIELSMSNGIIGVFVLKEITPYHMAFLRRESKERLVLDLL